MLSDQDIRYRMSGECYERSSIVVNPRPYDQAFQPASLDVKLGGVDKTSCPCILCQRAGPSWTIVPGEFVLATTLEHIEVPHDLAVRIEGKSSLGRKGLAVHITAGFIDPGFKGQITLELKNLGTNAIILESEQYIAQLSFHMLSSPALRPYGSPGLNSHYQNQEGVTPAWS